MLRLPCLLAGLAVFDVDVAANSGVLAAVVMGHFGSREFTDNTIHVCVLYSEHL